MQTQIRIVNHDPAAGAETILPSTPPNNFAGDHALELAACRRWFAADAGQLAKIETLARFANVRAHASL
jgi:hypothetical protein